jgi:hypothetical protein
VFAHERAKGGHARAGDGNAVGVADQRQVQLANLLAWQLARRVVLEHGFDAGCFDDAIYGATPRAMRERLDAVLVNAAAPVFCDHAQQDWAWNDVFRMSVDKRWH